MFNHVRDKGKQNARPEKLKLALCLMPSCSLKTYNRYCKVILNFLFLLKQMTNEFKQQSLQSMNTALQKAGRALSKITPNHARCLDAVNRCQDFISWLKEKIKGRRVAK